nr:hypothetical protein [Pseudomonas sp. HMWF021]
MDFPKSVPNIGLVGGVFVDENQATGTPGSLIPSVWGNSITQEVLNVIITAGLVPSEASVTQLMEAIYKIEQAALSSFGDDTGTANSYTAAYAPAITSYFNGMTLRFKAKTDNTGNSTFRPAGGVAKQIVGLGLQPLQGGEIVANGNCTVVLSGVLDKWILISSTGGAQQVPAAVNSQHAVRFGQVSGVVGQSKNLKASITVASASATWTADEVILETALGGLRYCISGLNQTITLTNTGTNGMDAGQAPIGGYVAIYAICTAGGTVRLLGVNATSTVAPPIYAGTNMPSGYIASALISVVQTNASRLFVAFTQVNNRIGTARQAFFGGSSLLVASPISISAVAPLNAVRLSGLISNYSGSASNIGFSLFSAASQVGEQNVSGTVSATGATGGNFSLNISTPQTIYGTTTNTAGTPTFSAFATEYEI